MSQFEYFCGCCENDISSFLTDDRKKEIKQRKKIWLELIICNECVEDSFCKNVGWRRYTHSEEGKKELIEREIKRNTDWILHCDKYLITSDPMNKDPMKQESIKLFENFIKLPNKKDSE